jgi:predicted secreted hydrolase
MRNKLQRFVATLASVFVAASPIVVSADRLGFTDAVAPFTFSFPRDHGSHPDYRTEWWYFTGHLQAPDGHLYGYELTFFRIGLAPGDPPLHAGMSRWRGNELYPAHFAISDISGHQFMATERLEREALNLAAASQTHLDAHVDDWHMAMDAKGMIQLVAKLPRYSLSLALTPQKVAVVHGEGGVSRKGACTSCASHYYSYTRLATVGSVAIGKTQQSVQGLSWMDHEFGSSQLEHGLAGWDWFAIMLNDNREVMIYMLRRKDGSIIPESSGTLVAVDGLAQHLRRDDITVHAVSTWTSPLTKASYPSEWLVSIRSENISLAIKPLIANQELANAVGTPPYWEGAADVLDAAGKSVGQAYVELTGYAAPIDDF